MNEQINECKKHRSALQTVGYRCLSASYMSFYTTVSPYIHLHTRCLSGCEYLLCARNHTRVEGMRLLGSLGIQGPGAALPCIGVRGVQLSRRERLHWLHAESKKWRGDMVPEKGRQGLRGCCQHTIHPQVQSSLVGLPSPILQTPDSPGSGVDPQGIWTLSVETPSLTTNLHRCQHAPPPPGAAREVG